MFIKLARRASVRAPSAGSARRSRDTGADFETFDIPEDEEVRQGAKEYSDWPTYPQLYVQGELVGGCDIILEMAADGSLKETLTAAA